MALTELFAADRATTTVSSGGTDAPSSGTTEMWTVASSAMFGAAATGVSQFHVADPVAPSEIIAVTNVSGTTWTVTRGADSTTPVTHTAGFTIYQVVPYSWLATIPSSSSPLALTAGGTGVSAASDAALLGDLGAASLLTRATVLTASGAAAANTVVPVNTTSGAVTVTLPNAPAQGTVVAVKCIIFGTGNPVTITCAGSDVFNKTGGGTSLTLNAANQGVYLCYDLTSGIWTDLADDLPLSYLDTLFLQLSGGTLTGSLAVGGALGTTPVTLTDAATILVNAAASNYFRVTLGGNRTLGTPSSPTDGQQAVFEVIQPGSGGPYTLSYSGGYTFPASAPQPSLSTAAGDHDFISFVYSASESAWVCTGYVLAQFGALVTIAQGGTGQTTAQAAINALTGVQTSGYYLRSGGTNAVLSAIQAADLPAATTSVQGAVKLDGTAADITANGTQIAGANAKSADSGHTHPANSIVPADHGLLAWSYDLDAAFNAVTLIAGTIYLTKIPIRYNLTATNLWWQTGSAGSGVSSGSFVGLYNSSGTLLTGSADLGASIYAGNHETALTTPQALTAGTFVWAAILVNQASTQPAVACMFNFPSSAKQNLNLTPATFRCAVPAGGTTQTALLGSFTPSSNTNTGAAPLWFGIS